MLNPIKSLITSSATAQVAPDLLKALAILSDRAVRRSAVDQEDLKPFSKSEKKASFLKVINKPIIYKFFQNFTNHRQKTNRTLLLSHRTYPSILKYKDLPVSLDTGKLENKIVLISSASLYEISGSHLFRTTTEIQSGPDTFDKSRLVMSFLTNLGVNEY